MPDPTNLAPPHVMTTAELIIYASAAVATAVGGVVAQTLRFGARVKALEAEAEKRKLLPADTGRSRDEIAAMRAEINPQAIAALVLAQVQPQVQSAATLAANAATAALQQGLTRLEAQHQATKAELDRLRDATDNAEAEGSRRWNDMARELGSIHRALKE